MTHRVLLAIVLLASFAGQAAAFCDEVPDGPWLTAASTNYDIHYTAGYEDDIPIAREWMNRAEEIMARKYGITNHGYDVDVYWHPESNEFASRSTSGICTRGSLDGTQWFGTIHVLALSSPDWEGRMTRGYLIHRYARILVHEYVTIGHKLVRNSGLDHDIVNWFKQGLQEYDGRFYTTEYNRGDGWSELMCNAHEHYRDEFWCCASLESGHLFATGETYTGGAIYAKFLADTYGEDIHIALLTGEDWEGNGVPSFWKVFRASLQARGEESVSSAFRDFKGWFNQRTASCEE